MRCMPGHWHLASSLAVLHLPAGRMGVPEVTLGSEANDVPCKEQPSRPTREWEELDGPRELVLLDNLSSTE